MKEIRNFKLFLKHSDNNMYICFSSVCLYVFHHKYLDILYCLLCVMSLNLILASNPDTITID